MSDAPVRIYNPQGIGAALRHFREEAGLTQEQLAERLGLTRFYVARLESGAVSEQVERIVALFEVLGARMTVAKADW
ncbi:MAG: helix-turn-helix transcriptional regulator [Thermoleophilia bacterium]|nr:helix-turn-helix transcriptional regulator [Thermoleophilia bacterium]